MSEDPDTNQTSDATRHSLLARGFSIDQIQEVQRIAQDIAAQQFQKALIATNNFIITLVAVLSSALGLATALAWNKALSEWLPTIKQFDSIDPLLKEFVYAGAMTLLTVVVIGVLVFATSRVKGENLLHQ